MPSYFDIPPPDPDVTRHWYICGSDRGLVASAYREVVSSIKGASRVLLSGGQCTAEDVIYELTQPVDESGDLRVIVVEDAHLLDLSSLSSYRSAQYPHFLVAVGGIDRPARSDDSFSFFFGRQSSRLVHCRRGGSEALVRVVRRRLQCGQGFAQELVATAKGDTYWLSSEVDKLALLGIGSALAVAHVPLVTSEVRPGDLIGNLLNGAKGLALEGIPSPKEAPMVYRTLETLIVKGCLLYEAQKNAGWSKRVLSDRTGLSAPEIDMLRPHINMFGQIPTERRLNALMRVADRALSGDHRAWAYIISVW